MASQRAHTRALEADANIWLGAVITRTILSEASALGRAGAVKDRDVVPLEFLLERDCYYTLETDKFFFIAHKVEQGPLLPALQDIHDARTKNKIDEAIIVGSGVPQNARIFAFEHNIGDLDDDFKEKLPPTVRAGLPEKLLGAKVADEEVHSLEANWESLRNTSPSSTASRPSVRTLRQSLAYGTTLTISLGIANARSIARHYAFTDCPLPSTSGCSHPRAASPRSPSSASSR